MCLVAQSCPTLCDLVDCSPPGSSVHGILQARLWNGLPCPPPEDLLNPGIEFRSFTLQVDPLPSEPPGNSKNTGVGSLSLLQGNLPDPGIEPGSPPLQVNSLPAELSEKPTIEGSKSYIMTFCLNEMSTGRQSACAG